MMMMNDNIKNDNVNNDYTSTINVEITAQQQSVRELEHPFLKVPFECLNKTFRASQKSVEKDLTVLEKAVKEMNKKAQKSKVSQEDACKYLDKVVNKLVGVKRKLEETDVDQERQLNICKIRMEHLDPSSTTSTSSTTTTTSTMSVNDETEWNNIRLNRILVDYFLRSGYYDSAIQLSKRTNITNLVDIDVFLQSRKVIDGLMAKNCTEALNWCSEHKSKLKKLKSSFEFELHIQEFIELVRIDERHKAIAYARKFFKREDTGSSNSTASTVVEQNSSKRTKFDSKKGSKTTASPPNVTSLNVSMTLDVDEDEDEDWKKRTKQIQQAMALLAFGKNTTLSPYRDLFSEDRWTFLIQLFEQSYFQLFSLTKHPLLSLTLQAGLSALKNPLVYQEEHFNVNDPMCHQSFQTLAEDLPFSFHVHSKLVCRISGKLMDDSNPPMALPNGNVYSLESMEQMALRNNGTIEDPRTGERYPFTSLKKLFIV